MPQLTSTSHWSLHQAGHVVYCGKGGPKAIEAQNREVDTTRGEYCHAIQPGETKAAQLAAFVSLRLFARTTKGMDGKVVGTWGVGSLSPDDLREKEEM